MNRASTVLLTLLLAAPAAAQSVPSTQSDKTSSVRRIQKVVEEMRGLEFQVPVTIGLKTPDEVRAMIMQSFEDEAPVELVAKQEAVYKAFGLIPADFPLRAKLIDFLAENIGGYYDPEAKQLFLVDMSEKMEGMGGMAGVMDEMVIAHEVHHALQDQNFDLSRWFDVLGDHEDRVQAYKSLVEGEAQLVGMTYMFKKMGRGDVDLKQVNRMQKWAMQMSPEGAKMREIPAFLVENMMFPYTQGAEFIQGIQRSQGWDRLGAAFADPPTSTEQILHPEKYLGERDEPTELELVGLGTALGEGAEDLYSNTLGEFNVSILLRALGMKESKALDVAAGWDGDTYSGFQTPDGRTVVVWLSTWDTEDEAKEFEAAYGGLLKTQRPDDHLSRRGTEVLLVHGSSGSELAGLVRRGFEAVKVEMNFTPLQGFSARPPVTDFTEEQEATGAAPSTSPSTSPSTTPSTTPAAAKVATLLHIDSLGATLPVPGDFEEGEDPIPALSNYSGAYFAGPQESELRLIGLPIPFEAAKTQLEALLQQSNEGFELKQKTEREIGGRQALLLEFVGALPGSTESHHTSVMSVSAGAITLLVASSVPEGDTRDPNTLLESVLDGLWLDGSPAGKVERHTAGGVTFEQPEGFKVAEGPGAPVISTLAHSGGAKVQVVSMSDTKALGDTARRLHGQLIQLGAVVRSNGITTRDGREVQELEFDVNGQRTRQLTFLDDGRRYTIACSAPVEAFEGVQVAFGRVLASFQLADGASEEATPAQPEQPKPDRRLY